MDIFDVKSGSIGNRLRQAAELLGFKKQQDFLKESGINSSTFYAIIRNNRVPQGKILKLLRKIKINTDWLITGEGEPLLASEPKQEIEYSKQMAMGERLSDQEGQASPSQDIEKLKTYLGQPMRDKPVPVSPSSREDVFSTVVKVLLTMSSDDLQHIKTMISRMIRDDEELKSVGRPRENH